MDLSTLREFVILASNPNYSLTAKQLYISQSTLSKHIQMLEQETGMRLLVRDSHSVRPTEAGRYFADKVQGILEDYDAALKGASDIDKKYSSVLRLGYPIASANDIFLEAYREFSSKNPDAKLVAFSMEIYEVLQQVLNGTLDVGYVTIAGDMKLDGVNSILLKKDPVGVLVESGHKLARKDSITFEDLAGEPIIVPSESILPRWSEDRESSFHTAHADSMRKLFSESPIELDLRCEMMGIGTLLPFLISQKGVAVAAESVVPYFGSSIRFIPLENQKIRFYLSAIWKSSHESESLMGFLECLRDASEKSRIY